MLRILLALSLALAMGGATGAQPAGRPDLGEIDTFIAQSGIPPGAVICSQTSQGTLYCRAGTTCCIATRSCCSSSQRCTSGGCVAIGTNCDICYRNLYSSVRARVGNPNFLRTYVHQAIASYSNCRAKATGNCQNGDQLVQSLRICDRFTDAGYAPCLKPAVGLQ